MEDKKTWIEKHGLELFECFETKNAFEEIQKNPELKVKRIKDGKFIVGKLVRN